MASIYGSGVANFTPNVQGTSELSGIAGQIANELADKFVAKDGNTVTSDLRIGTNNNHGIIIETNNTPRVGIDTAGNMSMVGTLHVGGGQVALGAIGAAITATGNELILAGGNKNIHLHPKGALGLQIDVDNNNLNIATATSGQGTVQIRANAKGTAARPQYSFKDKTNTGIYLNSDGFMALSQDGSDVFRCYNTGLDMNADQIFFNTLPGPTYYPQICWDQSGSRDTGIYSPEDGILQFRNNAEDTLRISTSILCHRRAHNNAGSGNIGIDFPLFESRLVTTLCYNFGWKTTTGSWSYYNNFNFDILYTRVGNIITGMASTTATLDQNINIVGLIFPVYYQKVEFSSQTASPPTNARQNYAGTLTMTNNVTGTCGESRLSPITIGSTKHFGTDVANAAVITSGSVITLTLNFRYVLTQTT
jgi:hypothetical protein